MGTSYTTNTASAIWTTAAHWTPNGVPGDTDTATIATGHTCTIPDGSSVTVGPSGASGTAAITIQGTGKLIVGTTTGAVLITRGDLLLGATATTRVVGFYQLTLNAGSTLTFDASQATTPLSQTYVCGPTQTNSPNAAVQINGTSSAHVTVNSNTGGGNGRFSLRGFNTRLGRMVATWCDFSQIGDSTNPAFDLYLNVLTTEPDTFSLTDCTLDYCGTERESVVLTDGTVFSYVRVKRTNSLCTNCCLISATSANTSGTRAFTDCSFDVAVGSGTGMGGFAFTRCVLYGGWVIAVVANKYTFTDCFVRKSNSSGISPVNAVTTAGGDFTRMLYLVDNTSTNNSKWFQNPTGYDITLDGGHLESTHTADTNGDFMSVITSPSTLKNITIKHHTVAFIPNGSNNERPETLWSVGSPSANVGLYSEHNTWIAGSEAHFSIGETNSSPAGVIKSFKSNITYAPQSPAGALQYHIHDWDKNSTNAELASSAADVDYNCGYGLKTGSDGGGYNFNCAGTPGAHDVNVNPNFVDPTRTLAKWALSRGQAETTAAALALLRNDTSLITDAYAWIKAGWAPTNATLRNAGHDGITIGAVEWTSAATYLTNGGEGPSFNFLEA